jgi:monomeric isocitrate dehydrogenase
MVRLSEIGRSLEESILLSKTESRLSRNLDMGGMEDKEEKIAEELLTAQGDPVNIGGYYLPDPEKATKAMRPSATFNAIIDAM